MSIESPRRLKDGEELGAILRAADSAVVTPERLAATGDKVKAAIAAGAATSAFSLWKLGVLVILVGGAIAVQQKLSGGGDGGGASGGVAPIATATDEPRPPDVEVAYETAPPAPVAPAPPPPPVRRARPAPPPPAPPAPAPSALPEQIRLYEEARAAGARGEFAAGLGKLDELLRRFPSTPLRADAELSRADLLTRANRKDEARAALEALAADPAHRGRRGELLRTLGDLLRKHDDCPAAIDAYTRARAAGLSARERARVDRGLARCAPR